MRLNKADLKSLTTQTQRIGGVRTSGFRGHARNLEQHETRTEQTKFGLSVETTFLTLNKRFSLPLIHLTRFPLHIGWPDG